MSLTLNWRHRNSSGGSQTVPMSRTTRKSQTPTRLSGDVMALVSFEALASMTSRSEELISRRFAALAYSWNSRDVLPVNRTDYRSAGRGRKWLIKIHLHCSSMNKQIYPGAGFARVKPV